MEEGSKITEDHLSKLLGLAHRNSITDSTEIDIPVQGIDLEEMNKRYMLRAIEISKGNLSKAARLLGLSRPALAYRLEKYGFPK